MRTQNNRQGWGWLILAILLLQPMASFSADYPGWWRSRNVITNVTATNDYAAINAGQLKWMASNACAELQAYLPGGAGTNVTALIGAFPSTSNYVAVNLGQLKYVAKPFYDRLIAEGITNAYPWTTATTDDVSYAMVNVGQLKTIFGFSLLIDSDSDGIYDWQEAINRTDPHNSDTNAPTVHVLVPANNSMRILWP